MARRLRPPPAVRSAKDFPTWAFEIGKWFYELYRMLIDVGVIGWDSVDPSGSSLLDIEDRRHQLLQDVKTLDTSSSDTVQDKHASNAQGKAWDDHVAANQNVHGIGSGNAVVGTGTTQTLTNKTVDKLAFQLTPSITPTEGDVYWDATDKTLAVKLEGTSTTLQVGQEQHLRATNKTGADIANGKVVYVNGAQGSRPTIALAKADADATSHAIGLATMTITNNQTGYVTTTGLVRGVDTSAWTAGTTVYLSASTAGEMTSTPPSFPNYVIRIGCVTHQDATDGIIDVHVGIEPSNHVMLNHLGAKDAQIGAIGDSDYTNFETDGTMQAIGDATCWDDSQVPAFDARNAAASLTLDALVGTLYNPRFDLNDEIFGSIQLSHRMKTTGTVVIKPHIHLINKNAIGATNYNVKFEFDWAWANLSSTALGTVTSDPKNFSFQNESALTHKLFSFTDITAGAGQGGISSYFLFRLKRVTADSAAYNTNDIFFAGFDLHFETDMLGSREPSSK